MYNKCANCGVEPYCGVMVSSSRLCKLFTEEIQWEAYIMGWLEEQSSIPYREIVEFFLLLEHLETLYYDALWSDIIMFRIKNGEI